MLWLPWLSWLRAISQKHGGSEIEDCTVFCWLDFRGSGGAMVERAALNYPLAFRMSLLQAHIDTSAFKTKVKQRTHLQSTWRCFRTQDLLEGLGGGVVEVHGVCSHENQDDGDTLLLGLGRSLKHLKKLYVWRFSEAEAITSHLNPPRQMLARIESKLEEYLTYLDEASWIQWKWRLIIRKNTWKNPNKVSLAISLLHQASQWDSNVRFWQAHFHVLPGWKIRPSCTSSGGRAQEGLNTSQHPNINGLCMSILLMFTTIKVSETLSFHGCLFLLSEYMPYMPC